MELNSFNWNNILNSVDVDEASEMFNKVIGQILDKYTIIENKSAKASKLKPWITNGLLKSIRYRDKLSKQLRHHPFNTQLRARFTRYRNILISLIKKAKYRFYKTKIDEANGDSRKFWNIVNEVAGRPSRKGKFPVEGFCAHGDTATPDVIKIVSNNFNNYFASVGAQLGSTIKTDGPAEVDDAIYATDKVFSLRPVTQQEL